MNIHVDARRLKPGLDTIGFIIDLLMIALVIVNLALIVFDGLFGVAVIRMYLAGQTPGFHEFYSRIHENFPRWDMMFVAVYLTEFVLRWLVAAARRTYHRWFFFPFIHWYDLLGCIPVGAFRWLRLLRVVSLCYRLQYMGVVDLQNTVPGRFLRKYYNVVVEEISDRVVLNVLDGVKREISEGNPLMHRIETEVLGPRKAKIVTYATDSVIDAARGTHREYRDRLGAYLAGLVNDTLSHTRNGARLATIPVAGPRAIALIGDTVRDLGVSMFDQVLLDLEDTANRKEIERLVDRVFGIIGEDSRRLTELTRDILMDVVDQVKARVAIQQWKLREDRES